MHVGQAIVPALSHPGVEQSAVGSDAFSSRADMAARPGIPAEARASMRRLPLRGSRCFWFEPNGEAAATRAGGAHRHEWSPNVDLTWVLFTEWRETRKEEERR